MDYDNLCKEILEQDQNIRFAGVSDDTGQIRYGGSVREALNFSLQRKQKDQIYRHWLGGVCVIPCSENWQRKICYGRI